MQKNWKACICMDKRLSNEGNACVEKIIFFLPNLSSGGAERVVSILSRELSKRDYDVSIAVLNDNNRAYAIEEKVSVNIFGGHGTLGKIKRTIKLNKFLKQQGRCVVFAFHPVCLKYAIAASTGTKCSVVACERNDPYSLYQTPNEAARIKRLYRKAAYAVFQTEDARNFYGVDLEGKSRIIINPILPPKTTWKGNINKHRIVSVCRLEKQKNLFMAIDAMKSLKDDYKIAFSYDVFGRGELEADLKTYCVQQGLEQDVHFKGVTNEVIEELADSSLFISSSDFEGISNSMLEALSVGMPVICTDCPIGGAKMAIDDGVNGYLVPVGNADALAKKIYEVFTNNALSIQIGQEALKSSAKWSVDKVTEEWAQVCQTIFSLPHR